MLFTLSDVETHIKPEPFSKGWELFTTGQITAPNIQRGGELITAVIPQDEGRPLRVYVRTEKAAKHVTINGECSCVKKNNCEHVAAVLLQALDDRQAQSVDAKTDRSTTLSAGKSFGISLLKPSRKLKPRQAKPLQTLLYVLKVVDSVLLVGTHVARRLENGRYTSSSYFEPGRVIGHAPARFLLPDDLKVLKVLNELPRSSDSRVPQLAGPQSVQTLETILATGRCYFEDSERGQPLRQGKIRSVDFQWQMDNFGYQQVAWRIKAEAGALLLLPTPWYLDSEKGLCGPLNSDLHIELIQELLVMAPIEPERAASVNKALVKSWPDSAIPLLQQLEIKTLPMVEPVPCLRLTTVEQQMWGDRDESHDFACLGFTYLEGKSNEGKSRRHKFSRHDPSTRLVDGQLIRVQRDKKLEQVAVKQLLKLGFEEDQNWSQRIGDDCFFPEFDLMESDLDEWLNFQMKDIPGLVVQGWDIEYDNFRYQLAEVNSWTCKVEAKEKTDKFSVGLSVDVDGQSINLLPILLDFLEHFPNGLPALEDISAEHFIVPLVSANNENGDEQNQVQDCLLHLPVTRVLPLLEILLELYQGKETEIEMGMRLSRVQLARLTALDQVPDGPQLQWSADTNIQQLARRLRELDGIAEVAPPKGLRASLRPYQQQGLNWLQFLREYQLAGILADDMGLGKTVQALAHLQLEKEAGRADRPSLVIAPTSLMFNWRHEAERFAPQLKVLVLHGPRRKQRFHTIKDHDLIITTYPLLARDSDTLLKHDYHLLILDEAQVIKNPKAQASLVVRDINARHRLCLTGTPMENHLGELWSLFDFLLPGLLGESKQFRSFFRTPIEKHGRQEVAERLSSRIRPFLLRRSKQQVAKELPEKTEIIQTVALEGKQLELYETVRLAMHGRVREEIKRQGLARSHIIVLDALLKLRQVCCDPRLLKMDKASNTNKSVKQSAKLEMLMDMLPEMVEEGRRILLFSQFTTMLGFIEDELKTANIEYVKLTGQTRDRETPVRRFQDGKVPVFLISLKAGGVGLNLTAADTVIHYDPWWNPAVERQATDRAHRIGQQQAVFVYKLICEGTLEEKIQAMQQRKQALADGLYRNDNNNEPQWNEQDLEALFESLDEH